MDIHFDLRWRLGQEPPVDIEPELFLLLQAIQEGGSLRVAAKERSLSYRHVWGLMQRWEGLFGQPLVLLERGKGAKLTRLGEKLLWGQRRFGARLGPELENLASELNAELRETLAAKSLPPLRVSASHGLAIVILRDLIHADTDIRMDLQFRGGMDSLQLFARSKCDVAGFHVPEGTLGQRLAPRYQRWLNPETDNLIHVVRRRQGLMTVPGNPKQLQSIAGLVAGDVRFVNRQRGSGTRLLLDLLLEEAGLAPDQIQGYHTEEFTHLAVAALVASGAADAGFGIEAAAGRFGLGFIPIVEENYLFAVKSANLANPAVSTLIEMLGHTGFREKIAALPGYDASRSAMRISVDAI